MPVPALRTIPKVLQAGELATTNGVSNKTIKSLIAPFGYDDAKMAAGKGLYAKAIKLCQDKTALAGAQAVIAKKLADAFKAADAAYQDLVTIVKSIWFQDRETLKLLGAQGKMPRNAAAFIVAGYQLFDNASNNSSIMAKLTPGGYPPAKMAGERAKIAAYEDFYNKHQASKGQAQQAARDQKKAVRELRVWLLQFFRMAKVALKDRPDLQEEIGMLARSDGYHPRKKKPAPGTAGPNPKR